MLYCAEFLLSGKDKGKDIRPYVEDAGGLSPGKDGNKI